MRPLLRSRVHHHGVERAAAFVAECYGVTRSSLFSDARHKSLAEARAVTYLLARETTDLSFPELGATFNRDHSTILQTIKKLREKMGASERIAERVNRVLTEFGVEEIAAE